MLTAGARPNLIKLAPLLKVLEKSPDIEPVLVYTGQHYSDRMWTVFLQQLHLPEPKINLNVGSGTHVYQISEIMRRFEPVLEAEKPDLVFVFGDVNSTLACALTAVKMGIQVAHVEAGLRSFDLAMPEEINRKLTDAAAHYLFITEESARENLLKEGISLQKIHFVGNTMIDTLFAHMDKIDAAPILQQFQLQERQYAVVTLHRPSNVDNKQDLLNIAKALETISQELPLVFPAHPRTVKQLQLFGVKLDFIKLLPPLGYFDFLKLVKFSRCVLTDSGGIQEETSVLSVPCLTLRNNTERPVTVQQGTNRIVGNNPKQILNAFAEVFAQKPQKTNPIKYWDGQAAKRIVKVLTT